MKLKALDCGPEECICMSPHSLPAANPPSLPAELSQPASLLSSHFTHKPSLPPQGLPFSSPLLNSSSHVRRQRVSKQAAEPCISQLCFSHGGSSSSGALRSWFLSRGIQATGFLILHPPGSAEEGVGGEITAVVSHSPTQLRSGGFKWGLQGQLRLPLALRHFSASPLARPATSVSNLLSLA